MDTRDATPDLVRLPGLFRVWDLQFVLAPGADYQVCFAESTGDGTPLFLVYERRQGLVAPSGTLQ